MLIPLGEVSSMFAAFAEYPLPMLIILFIFLLLLDSFQRVENRY